MPKRLEAPGMALLALLFLVFSPSAASAQTCVQPPPGMVSWWPGDGTATDIQGGNDGTLRNGATFAPGKVGQAFSLDGVNDYVGLGAWQIIGDNTTFSIDAWVRADSFDDPQSPIYGEFNTGTSDVKNYLAVGGPNRPFLDRRVFFDQFIPFDGYLLSSSQLEPGHWYHIAYVQDGVAGTRSLYINGALDVSDQYIEVYAGAVPNDVRIGMRGGTITNQRFDGLIDEVEIFDRALSASEVQAIFEAGGAGKCKPVTAVEIDIKPGSEPNSINLCSNAAVPVAIFGSATLDVWDIDTDNLRFAEAAVKVVGRKDPHQLCSYEDINGDFVDDLVCHFVTTDIAGTDGESTTATVRGELLDGTPIEGADSVNIVKDTCS